MSYLSFNDAKEEKEMRVALQKDVGHRVRALRNAKGWTQEKLAQAVNINNKHVYHIEKGGKCMSFWVLVKLSEALGVPVEALLSEDNKSDTVGHYKEGVIHNDKI
jgi:ribosome-binding protein aMBF1 (putative translation factor)